MSYGTGANAPFGLRPIQGQGSAWSGQTNEYKIKSGYNTSIFTGDPVKMLSDGTIGLAVAGDAIIGVFQGCKYNPTTQSLNSNSFPFWAASTVTLGGEDANAMIVDEDDVLYDIQVSTSVAGPTNAVTLLQTNMNQNANFQVTATTFNPVNGVTPAPNPGTGSTRSGQSGYYLDFNTLGAGTTLNLALIRLTQIAGNAPGIIFNNAVVAINNHRLKGGTGTAGV